MTGRPRKTTSASSRDLPNGSPTSVAYKSSPPALPVERVSKLPRAIQFPLVVLLNYTFTYFFYQIGADFTHYELSAVSKRNPELWHAAALLAWRVAEMALSWFGKFDDYDVAALTIVSRLPFYYLLNAFYDISLRTTIICLLFDTLGSALPFTVMRSRAASHVPTASVPNLDIVHDPVVALLTTIVPAAVYAVLIYASFATWLPVHIVTYFDGVKSLEGAHNSQLPELIVSFFPLGWAARAFLFSPSSTAAPSLADARSAAFNPSTATLAETVKHNVWGWRKGWKVLIRRVAVLAAVTGVTTWVRVWGSLEGSEPYGAFGWAALWSGATIVVGMVLGWVGEL